VTAPQQARMNGAMTSNAMLVNVVIMECGACDVSLTRLTFYATPSEARALRDNASFLGADRSHLLRLCCVRHR